MWGSPHSQDGKTLSYIIAADVLVVLTLQTPLMTGPGESNSGQPQTPKMSEGSCEARINISQNEVGAKVSPNAAAKTSPLFQLK